MLIPALTDFAKANDDWRIFVFSAILVAIICVLVAAATRGERVPFTPCRFISARSMSALPVLSSNRCPA